ncbi:Glutamate receptor ionotropic kainate 3, partial [Fasciolopsis buskii]
LTYVIALSSGLLCLLLRVSCSDAHIIHWKAEPRSNTLLTFGLSDYDQNFAKFAIDANLSVAMILLPISGDIGADFTALCGFINKTVRPVALVDASWPELENYYRTQRFYKHAKPEDQTFNRDEELGGNLESNGLRQQSLQASTAIRCYRRQLLVSLSSRLQLPLATLMDMTECPATLIESAIGAGSIVGKAYVAEYPYHRLSNPASPPLIQSLAPSQDLMAELLKHITLLNEEMWKGFAIVYENERDFEKYRNTLEHIQIPALLRHWGTNSFSKAKIVRDIKHLQAFFLDLSTANVEQFFQMLGNQAVDIQYADYFIFNNGPLQPLIYALRKVKGKLMLVRYKIPGMGRNMGQQSLHRQLSKSVVDRYAEALRLIGPQIHVPEQISCKHVESTLLRTADGILVSHKNGPYNDYKHGQALYGELNRIFQNSVGYVEDQNSRKVLDYGVELIRVDGDVARKYADWSMKNGFQFIHANETELSTPRLQLENKTFIVTTIEDPPFVVYEPFRQGKQMQGNDQWTGFAIELLRHLSEMNHFDYVIKPVEDKKFGTFDETKGRWDGMIGELIYKKAHLAVASLTITYDRERVIDFTTPFMSLSLSVIIRKSNTDPGLQFTAPLSREVWLSVLIAYLVVSLTLFFLGRVTPNEWYVRHPCSPRVENQFTLLNSFWFTVGSLMQQGCDISLRATSTRIIGTIWWFFILIMVSSYTANLAAFLTIDRMETDIENVEDLTRQTKIKYGTLYGGSTYSFFKHSDIPTYQRMWEFMNANKSLFVNKTEDGIVRALDGNYAFILESTLNEYYSQRNCLLTPLGGLLDPRGYGIGLPIGNNGLRDLLSESILKLQKDQTLEKMRQFWLQRYNATVPCYLQNSQSSIPSRSKLTLSKMSSAFIGLGAGLLLGVLVWIVEMTVWIYRLRNKPPHRTCDDISNHLRTVLCGSCHHRRRHSIDETLFITPIKPINGGDHHANNIIPNFPRVTTL